ncbi:MAG: class I SAM-dependent methyltransferase [Rhodobacter sp.]|nr:class I SAM-dependent methyltransferase [Rhodobacter sp.]
MIARDLSPAYGPRLRVFDIGCGTCKAFDVLGQLRDDIDYVGVDRNQEYCTLAQERYGGRGNFEVHCASVADTLNLIDRFDLIIGLETFEHIPEPTVVRVIEAIGRSDFGRLYVTVPNEVGPAVAIKNLGSMLMGYTRHKQYTWAETFFAATYELDRLPPHHISHKGFDWRWLAQTLRGNVRIVRKFTSPSQIVPRAVSPSIGFLCEKRPVA